MYKVIVTLNNHKVIHRLTEKVESHQQLTFNLENELPKYLDYLRHYLSAKLSRLSLKISRIYLSRGDRQKSQPNKLDYDNR